MDIPIKNKTNLQIPKFQELQRNKFKLFLKMVSSLKLYHTIVSKYEPNRSSLNGKKKKNVMNWWNKIKDMAGRMTPAVSIETPGAGPQERCEASNRYSRIHYQ